MSGKKFQDMAEGMSAWNAVEVKVTNDVEIQDPSR